MTNNINNLMPLGEIVDKSGNCYVAVLHYYSSTGTPLSITQAMQDQRVQKECLDMLGGMVNDDSYSVRQSLTAISGIGFHCIGQSIPHNEKTQQAWNHFLEILRQPEAVIQLVEGGKPIAFEQELPPLDRGARIELIPHFSPERRAELEESIEGKYSWNEDADAYNDPSASRADLTAEESALLRSQGFAHMSQGVKDPRLIAGEYYSFMVPSRHQGSYE